MISQNQHKIDTRMANDRCRTCAGPEKIDTRLAKDQCKTGARPVQDRRRTIAGPAQDRRRTGAGSAQDWHRTGAGLALDSCRTGAEPAQNRHRTGTGPAHCIISKQQETDVISNSRSNHCFFKRIVIFFNRIFQKGKGFLGIGRLLNPMNNII